ncbi:chondroitin lyase, partial [Vibrio sp. 10N.286.46.A8]
TGANDPDFNLKSEPALILRQSGQNHVFASVLETHGYFNESIEASVGARGLVKSVSVVGHNSVGTVVRIQTTSGNTYHYGISNQAEDTQQATHTVEFAGETYSWEGSFAQL